MAGEDDRYSEEIKYFATDENRNAFKKHFNIVRRNLRSREVRAGIAENAYLREEYEYYFPACGFQLEFIAVYPNWKWKTLAPLNGLLMAKYNIWATRYENI